MVSPSVTDPVQDVSDSFPAVDPAQLRFVFSAVQIVPRVLQSSRLSDEQSRYLAAEIAKRLQLPVTAADALIAAANHPSYRADLTPRVRKAKIERLRYRPEEVLDLPPEAKMVEKYGIKNTLSVTEILLGLVQRTPDALEKRNQLLRVFRLAKDIGLDPILITALFRKWSFIGGEHSQKEVRLESGRRIMIGSHDACDITFFDPLVEPLHASLCEEQGSWIVRAETSHRPLWCNDKIVDRAAFPDGARIQVGPYSVLRNGHRLELSEARKLSALSAIELNRKIGDISLLDDISFTVFTGEVIALIGPSGAGKTTLLNAINGVAPADSGQVLFNGQSFHEMLANDKSLIGIVPQDDLVLPELTVEESLYYSGRLRLPSTCSKSEIMVQVERVLHELDIAHIRKQRIGDALRRGISGGQRKRVNLGQELISQSTQILFLDEPTSGLDPRASQDIVRLVRNLSDNGRIVFLVTHDLTDQIIGLVDDLLVLVKGGKLAYFGEQADALTYFGVESTDKIFQKFDAEQSRWAERYKVEPDYGMREIAINEFSVADTEPIEPPVVDNWLKGFWRQFTALTSRYAKVKLRDRTGMLVMMLQPPFLALVMTIVFRHYPEGEPSIAVPSQSMIYMMSLSCLWFGMSAAVRELISDQVIFRRERRVGVGVAPYVLSKFFILAVLTAIQAIFLILVMHSIFGMNEYGFSISVLSLVACLTSWVGMSLGLLISSIWRSSEAAVGTLPLILIPQIALSSILYSIRDMGQLAQLCTWGTFQRYTFDAFLKSGEEVAVRNFKGEFDHQAVQGTLWKLGLKLSDKVDDIGLTLLQLNQIMVGFILGMLVLTLTRVHYRDRHSS